jgi:hypothetical protein
MQKIINLTPHVVTVGGKKYPASGQIARVSVMYEPRGQWDGVSLVAGTYGDIVGLPERLEPETLYIVSSLVRSAAMGRISGLASPAGLIRDTAGNIIGCESLEVDGGMGDRVAALRAKMDAAGAETGCTHGCCGSSSTDAQTGYYRGAIDALTGRI